MDEVSLNLLARCREGDDQAAAEIFDRYVERLLGLARKRISPRLARRVDAEDIVQSAYRSFFGRAAEGRYQLERGGDLWRLLAAITVNKVLKQAERHGAAKRAMSQEQSMARGDASFGIAPERVAREPSPEEVLGLAEQLEKLLGELPPHHRQMVELRLQGATVEEVAEETDVTQRQVRRVLNKVRDELEGLLGESETEE